MPAFSSPDPAAPEAPAAAAALRAAKAALRRRMAAAPLHPDPLGAGTWLAARVLEGCPPPPGAVVAGVWPLPGEIDLRPLMLALAGRGHPIALPCTPVPGAPLLFRRFRFGEPLRPARFGTSEPDPAAPVLVPGFLLVPLVAFDRAGRRLGRGAGYYDRTLAALRAGGGPVFVLGCAFAAQEAAEVPAGPTDAPLDAVATEAGLWRCPSAPGAGAGR